MKLLWTAIAWEDYLSWRRSDPAALNRINELIRDCMRTPFSGLGKLEPLKADLKGC
jgi:toxin YoeB